MSVPRKSASAAKKSLPQTIPDFTGFPEEGLRFLAQLKKHNDREWFRERKPDYDVFVQQPMHALVLAASEACRARGLPLFGKEKNPVMRVYRDIRFSKDKRPFKTHVSADLRRSFNGSSCLLYIHVSPAESFLGAGIWQPDRSLLQAWREAIVQQPARFEKLASTLAKRDVPLSREHSLSSMPRGLQSHAESSIAAWLKLTSFTVGKTLSAADITSPTLPKTIADFAFAAKPFLEFAWSVEATCASSAFEK